MDQTKQLELQTLFGQRLKRIRMALELTQIEVAETLNLTQVQITRVERGRGGSLITLYMLLNYYSRSVYVDLIFSENFDVVLHTGDVYKTGMNSIIKEKLGLLKDNIDNIMTYID